jgi:dsRNA-specific ribonuclease
MPHYSTLDAIESILNTKWGKKRESLDELATEMVKESDKNQKDDLASWGILYIAKTLDEAIGGLCAARLRKKLATASRKMEEAFQEQILNDRRVEKHGEMPWEVRQYVHQKINEKMGYRISLEFISFERGDLSVKLPPPQGSEARAFRWRS